MLNIRIIAMAASLAATLVSGPAYAYDNQAIARMIIQESIASYPGSCACPYSRDRGGRRCGRRSAWSRPGGYSPICYTSDVTPRMIDQWRRTHN